jgi:hypothetical protein
MGSKNKTSTKKGLYVLTEVDSAIIEVEFGSPMKNCLHYGICRVNIPSAYIGERCSCRSLAVIQNFGDGLVRFIFNKNKLTDSTHEKYFKKGIFQIDDEYEIPKDILQKIGLEKFLIKKGLYPILIERHILKIIF